MGFLYASASLGLFILAAVQAANALDKVDVRGYPFINSESSTLKWAYVSWLVFMGIVAATFAVWNLVIS